jgi:hypothetical protein
MIEVFVHSHDRYVDVDFYREMSHHIDCGLARWASTDLSEQFKGRILSEKDLKVLKQAFEIAEKGDFKVKVYDVSRMTDRIKALRRGILKTPAAVVDGKRYEDLEEFSQTTTGELDLQS